MCDYVYMKTLYNEYIKEMSSTWSDSSTRSESTRLNKVLEYIDLTQPEDIKKDKRAAVLWDALAEYNANARSTYWTRVVAFYDWCIENEKAKAPNPYRLFRKKNRRCFTNVYERKPCEKTFNEAYQAINKIEKVELRNRALLLLEGGLRHTESHTLKDSYVIGKGGKQRRVYCRPITGPCSTPSQYSSLLRAVKEVLGVGPHKLRSIFANELVRKGANAFELKKAMGWSNLATAESYISANDDTIKKMVESVQGGTSSGSIEVPKGISEAS
jgi:site-specific recombinase XerD